MQAFSWLSMLMVAVVILYPHFCSWAVVAPNSESSQHDGVRLAELNSPVTKAYGSLKSANHPSVGHMAICAVASSHLPYMVVVWNCWMCRVMPIPVRFCWMRAASLGDGSVWSTTVRTSLHSVASHTPSWLESYFDCIISALA